MTDMEKLIAQIMKEAEADGEPVTREEAIEMAEMEIKAKGIKNYTQSEESVKKKAERKPREKKIDADKQSIIKLIAKCLTDAGYDATIVNEDKLIDFGEYTVNLIKHRPKKNK